MINVISYIHILCGFDIMSEHSRSFRMIYITSIFVDQYGSYSRYKNRIKRVRIWKTIKQNYMKKLSSFTLFYFSDQCPFNFSVLFNLCIILSTSRWISYWLITWLMNWIPSLITFMPCKVVFPLVISMFSICHFSCRPPCI